MQAESEPFGHRYLYLREDIHPPVWQPRMSEADYRRRMSSWSRGLNPEQKLLHEMLTGQVFGLLGISSGFQIQSLIEHPELRQAASRRTTKQLGLIYGIKDPERMEQKLEDYSHDADAVRDHLGLSLSYIGSPNLEMVNEVRATSDLADLLLLSLDGRWTERTRWDAKVKLQLMCLAAAIDRRQRELGTEDQFKRFVNWMHERVWNPKLLLGESRDAYLISTHEPETWACTKYQWIEEEEGAEYPPEPFQKKTHLPRRSFQTQSGRDVDIYVTIRDKTMEMKIVKMLRKKVEDPSIAVDDETGFLVVVNNIRNGRQFIEHLIYQGYQSNHPIIIEDVSYTLDGGKYEGNHGSSPKLRIMKFFVRLANEMRIECIVHTPATFAESLYMRGVSHYEYRLNRLIDAGVPDLIFPQKYFPHLDIGEVRRQKLTQIRGSIENPK